MLTTVAMTMLPLVLPLLNLPLLFVDARWQQQQLWRVGWRACGAAELAVMCRDDSVQSDQRLHVLRWQHWHHSHSHLHTTGLSQSLWLLCNWCFTCTVDGQRLNDIALHVHTSELPDVTCHMGSQCYLPSDTGELFPPNPSQKGWYTIYLPWRDGRL